MTSFGVQVRWDGEVVSGITSVTPLSDSVEVVTLREGGSDAVRQIPGRPTSGESCSSGRSPRT